MRFIILFILCITTAFATPSPAPTPVIAWTKLEQLPDTGAYVNYWREVSLHYDVSADQATLILNGYISKAAFLAGKSPEVTKTYQVPHGINPTLGAAGRMFISGYLRALPEFSGSIADPNPNPSPSGGP